MKSNDSKSCRCCKVCTDCTKEFQQVIDLKGLVIYRHIETGEVNNDSSRISNATKSTPADDIFIIQNTKDVELKSVDYLSTLDDASVSCDRCRQIVKHAQRLLHKVPAIDKNVIMGICDHCRLKQKPCWDCQQTVKKFFANINDDRENNKERIREWLSQVKNLLKDAFVLKGTGKECQRARSELNIDQICQRDAIKNVAKLDIIVRPGISKTLPVTIGKEIQAKLQHDIHFDDSNGRERDITLKHGEILLQSGSESAFYQGDNSDLRPKLQGPKILKQVVIRDAPPVPYHSEEDIDLPKGHSFIDRGRTAGKSLSRSPSRGIIDKTLKDYRNNFKTRSRSLNRGSMAPRYYEDMFPPSFTDQYKHDKEERIKVDSEEFFEQYTIKKNKLQRFERKEFDDHFRIRDITYSKPLFDEQYSKSKEAISQKTGNAYMKDVKYENTIPNNNENEEAILERRFSQFDKAYEEQISNKAKRPPRSVGNLKKSESADALLTAAEKYDKIPKDFSFAFPHQAQASNEFKRQKSSFELIKDTQDMLNARAIEERKRLEEERKKRAELEEKKRLVREDRERIAAENTKVMDKKKKLAEKPKKTEVQRHFREDINREHKDDTVIQEKTKKRKENLEIVKQKKEETPVSSTVTPKKETKIIKSKSEPKDNPKLEPKEIKSKTEPKAPQVDNNGLKSEKAALKAEKDNEKQRKEREENLRQENEAKRKDKEEKERLKKEKDEQAQNEKELKQKQRELDQKQKDLEQKQSDLEQKRSGDKKKEKPIATEKPSKEDKKKEQTTELNPKAKVEVPMKPKKDAEMTSRVSQPKKEATVTKEINFNKVKMRTISQDNLILQLVKVKQSSHNASEIMTVHEIKAHKMCHHYLKRSLCPMCENSDLELQYDSKNKKKGELEEIIIGQKIFRYRPSLIKPAIENKAVAPLLFQSDFDESLEKGDILCARHEENEKKLLAVGKQTKTVAQEQEPPKGVIRYALSDRTFIDKGWTMLPTEKMNVYRMRPAHPEFDWFEHNKNKRLMQHDSGERLAEFDDNGRGRWYYKNGRLALDYYDAEELNAQQRFVVYSSGEPDERGRSHPYTILATFDYLGNGIVFDHSGKIRLKYNQTEGVVLDRNIGPVSHWKWHTLNDPPVLQQVMIDTQMAHKDPAILKMGGVHDNKTRPDNEEMLAIEFDNFIKEKSKKLSQTFKPFQIKMKALKINENFSLKVLDQATVYLIFRDGTTNLKLNIGMVLDHKEIVDTDTAEVGEVSNNLERFPARTDSLAELQKSVAYATRFERTRTERERRLRPPEPCGSADKLTAAASRPLRFPLRTVGTPTGSTATSTRRSYCKCARKPMPNVYYDNRLF